MEESLETGNAVLQTIHASEGGRAYKLLQQRQKRQQEVEQAKSEIENKTNKRRIAPIDARYKGSSSEVFEEIFKHGTVGLVTVEQFREKRKLLQEQIDEIQLTTEQPAELAHPIKVKPPKNAGKRSKLSFDLETVNADDEEPEDKLSVLAPRNFGKDPTVDTSFLSDTTREEKLREKREKLIEDYKKQQEKIKEEVVEMFYVYWDGLSKNKSIKVKKGSTVGTFVHLCRQELLKEVNELRNIPSESLLFVKSGIILPTTATFYELLKANPSGQSGPLFELINKQDTNKDRITENFETDQGPVGKIVDKRWYEKNKHIFPASSWEQYIPGKCYQNKYKHLI